MSSNLDDPSLTPDALRNLSEEQTERLTAVLDNYLARLESGDTPDLGELLAQNSDIEGPLKLYLGKLGNLHNFAAGFSPHLSGVAEDELESADTFEPVPGARPLVGDDTDSDGQGSTAPPAVVPQVDQEPAAGTPHSERVPTKILTGDIDPQASATLRRLGDFELRRVIGRGGMGIVYEAQQLSLKRRVALKLLPLISVLDARQIARFKNEAQAAANLQHPNIVPVYAVGNYQGVHYYAMRFIDGHALDAIIAALRFQKHQASGTADAIELRGSLDLSAADQWTVPPAYQRVVRLGIQGASALAAAHEDGIIHRDVKPSNLMLDKNGKLWITDFGLARRMSDQSMTATGDVMGTLRYMSPEQSRGQAALVDGRSDVYSLGATLYELLVLEPAMTGESSPAMLRAIEHQLPIPLKQHRPDLPRDLITVIEKAMAKSREDRYLTAQDFADDLTRVLEGRPTLARPQTLLERGTKWVQRNQRLVRISTAIGLAALLFFGAGLIAVSNARRESWRAAQESRKRLDDLCSQSRAYLQITKELEGIAGTEVFRQQAYTRLLNDFRGFVSLVRHEEKMPAELATALYHMGELQCEMQDWPAAHASLSESQELLRAQTIKDPKRVEYRWNLAKCMTRLSQVASHNGDTPAAEEFGNQALQTLTSLAQAAPEDSELQYDRAKAANSLAQLWIRTGKPEAAADLLAQTSQQLGQAIERWPQRNELKEMLFYVTSNLASVLVDSTPHRATELYQAAVDIQTRVCQSDNRVRPTADLALAFTNLGRAHSREQNFESARTAYAKAHEINNLVCQLTPNSEYLRNFSINLNNLGMAERRVGDLASSEARFRKAIESLVKLCADSPNDAELDHELGGTYNNLANLLEKSGQSSEVDELYRLAIKHQEKALHASRSITKYRDFLDNHLLNYSRWLTEMNRFELALDTMQQRLALWPADDPHRVVIAGQLADAAVTLAADKRKHSEAVRYGKAAKEVLELARDAGLGVQSILERDSSSSLANLKSLTESARP